MKRDEAVKKLATVGHLSIAHAEDLYDSIVTKPVVKQYVADWYEEHKGKFDYSLWEYLVDWDQQEPNDFKNWINREKNAFQTLVNMYQFGYEVEKEVRYTVQLKGVSDINCYLNKEGNEGFLFSTKEEIGGYRTQFTRKELESNGFGWVFDCPGVEVKEVEDGKVY